MKSKIELSELIELIELANNPNTIYLADKLLSEKITSIFFTTNLGERTVNCEYKGLRHYGDRIGIFVNHVNAYILCGTDVQFSNDIEIKALKSFKK